MCTEFEAGQMIVVVPRDFESAERLKRFIRTAQANDTRYTVRVLRRDEVEFLTTLSQDS